MHLADDLQVPVLLAHGTEDRRVKLQHSSKLRTKLEKDGKDVTYLEFENGNHFLSNQDHRIQFFKAMDEFLQEHL